MTILLQHPAEIKSDCHMIGPICRREHFCSRCGWELNVNHRVPFIESFLCPRYARKKKVAS